MLAQAGMVLNDDALEVIQLTGNLCKVLAGDIPRGEEVAGVVELDPGSLSTGQVHVIEGVCDLCWNCTVGCSFQVSEFPQIAHQATKAAFAASQKNRYDIRGLHIARSVIESFLLPLRVEWLVTGNGSGQFGSQLKNLLAVKWF